MSPIKYICIWWVLRHLMTKSNVHERLFVVG